MSDDELQRLEQRLADAVQWCGNIHEVRQGRADIGALTAEVRRLASENAELRDAMECHEAGLGECLVARAEADGLLARIVAAGPVIPELLVLQDEALVRMGVRK